MYPNSNPLSKHATFPIVIIHHYLQISDEDNEHLKPVIDALPKIRDAGGYNLGMGHNSRHIEAEAKCPPSC